MNISFNNRNNNRYLILLSIVSVFSAIVFLASHEEIQQSVFANPQVTMKDQMNNMMGMQNQNMMMDPSQMQTMMQQMNQTGMMGMGPMMMGPMMIGPMMIGNQTIMGMMSCMMINPGVMGMGPMMMQPMNQTGMMGMGPMMMDPSKMQTIMEQMNKTGMMMGPIGQGGLMGILCGITVPLPPPS